MTYYIPIISINLCVCGGGAGGVWGCMCGPRIYTCMHAVLPTWRMCEHGEWDLGAPPPPPGKIKIVYSVNFGGYI